MAGLSAAALLTEQGLKVLVLEANYLPGGCSSSYFRKGYWFETGATTLVGLGANMPLQFVLDETGIEFEAWQLELPMQIHEQGQTINRYQDLDQWIAEAGNKFGIDQEVFWQRCYSISQFVWQTSLKQLHFPPEKPADLLKMAAGFRPNQLAYAGAAFNSTKQLLDEYKLSHHVPFQQFVNDQLMITAQNHMDQVNQLFGATALCYTNYPNYYVPGGLINMVGAFVQYIIDNGSDYRSRQPVKRITHNATGYTVTTDTDTFTAPRIVSAIPLNNTLELADFNIASSSRAKQLKPNQLWSAYQLSLAFKRTGDFESLHHQIQLDQGLPGIASDSIFLSMSHEQDKTRGPEDVVVASVSTHLQAGTGHHPIDQDVVNQQIISLLQRKGFLKATDDILYYHSSAQAAWARWTRRKWGFVGGYPQYMDIKPWQMHGHRLNDKGAYICGDSTYPGQGIPGASLSGIIVAQKLLSDR